MINPIPLSFFLLLLLSLTSNESQSEAASATSAYDMLRAHGLPIGLFPKGVREFRVDGDGRFEVFLEQACTAKFENEVHYEQNVTGSLTFGQIGSLSGISAQELFLWFPVKEIRVDIPSSGLIYFDVGVIYKQFSLSLFETPPDCNPISPDLREGKHIARIVSKSKSGKLRYDLDQEDAQRVVL